MPVITDSACGKFILTGEHAVVHGEPAIALPLTSRRIRLRVQAQILGPAEKIGVSFPALGLDTSVDQLPKAHPIHLAVEKTLKQLEVVQKPSCRLEYTNQLPIGAGLGSSAAMAVVTIRALSAFLGHPLGKETVNHLAYECEEHVHIHPSGIDNTVITYEAPILFQKEHGVGFMNPAKDFHFILADTGVQKSTRETVAALNQFLENRPDFVRPRIAEIGRLSLAAREALETGNESALAEIIDRNQSLLRELEISSPELDNLIALALEAGASAAKLTGGGRGGHILALVREDRVEQVLEKLVLKGALNPFHTQLSAGGEQNHA